MSHVIPSVVVMDWTGAGLALNEHECLLVVLQW
jgi:hypothetical protein